MGLSYVNLDAETRKFIVQEVDAAIVDGSIYVSPWLSAVGKAEWAGLLRTAALNGNDSSLAQALRLNSRISQTAQRKKPKSEELVTYNVPVTAADTISEGEFNRFYVRGLCRRAIENGIDHLEVYRAKNVVQPRPGSQEKIGSLVDPKAILEDLRTSAGVEPSLGLPPGPNSGLSLKLP